ncbi:hypothetical protein AC249_AIPGENE26880 [Exaiptasia diaphana]|nr:hypothetical protein AC249_AIPGENE26880 [Exaiptasia diaphana]
MECKRSLGEWIVNSQPVLIYELRYPYKNRIKIQLYYKPEKENGPMKDYGDLSTDLANSSLEPGEFCVQNYGHMKDKIKQLEAFPEFEVTKKRNLVRQPANGPLHVCPIWRLRSYDCMPDDAEVDLSAKEGGIVTTTFEEHFVKDNVGEEVKEILEEFKK